MDLRREDICGSLASDPPFAGDSALRGRLWLLLIEIWETLQGAAMDGGTHPCYLEEPISLPRCTEIFTEDAESQVTG